MSLPQTTKSNTASLPKSVKVRSTCNACQQAKIRCGHERPSCRRCQKHKIDCIYSMSRRLGRPAKKREPRTGPEEQKASLVSVTEDRHDRNKRARNVPKQKCQNMKLAAETHPSCRGCSEAPRTGSGPGYFQKLNSPEIFAEDSVLQSNFASETWLQELMSADVQESVVDTALDPSYDDFHLDSSLDMFCEGLKYPDLPLSLPATDSFLCSTTTASDSTAASTNMDTSLYNFDDSAHPEAGRLAMLEAVSTGQIFDGVCTWGGLESEPQSWIAPSTSASADQSSCHYTSVQSEISHDSGSFSSEELDLENFPDMTGCRCGCYVSELVQTGLQTSRNDSSNIAGILENQKTLQQQAESILRCEACPRSEARANMLMLIIVRVDSFLTTLEAAATSASPGLHDGMLPASIHSGFKKDRDVNGDFLSHINACPLLVGSFRVPNEEKTWFIRQMLQARLSMLLLTIRRIRVCTQQLLAVTPSRGRSMMIMETDRRLQLIIMKIRMMTA